MTSLGIKNRQDAVALLRGGRMPAFAPRLVEWLLVAVIAYLLARATISFFAPLPVPVGDQLAALPASASTGNAIEGRNPFPQAEVDTAVVTAGPDLTETALDLTLTGVWPKDEEGSAIIRRPDGEERRFAIGEEITSGVRLLAVYQDQVVIGQNGVRESLRFETKAPVTTAGARTTTQQATQPAAPQTANDASADEKIKNTPADMNQLSGAFRLAPGIDAAGKPALVLHPGSNSAAFEAAGLRAGDILRNINGAPPPMAPNELASVMSQFMKTGSATLVVERDGATQTITLSNDRSGN